MIYLKLKGRIGNQLFMYATARMIQLLKGKQEEIIIEDSNNRSAEGIEYLNSLEYYLLPNVKFVHDKRIWDSKTMLLPKIRWNLIYHVLEKTNNQDKKYRIALRNQNLYNKWGFFHIDDGYVSFPVAFKKDTVVDGYFQSEKFFYPIRDEIKALFRAEKELLQANYPNIETIKKRNSVCISIKVQHNVGNEMYDVCHETYYKRAIDYIEKHVENPLFFICSDDVEYVEKNLIDTTKYDVVRQDTSQPDYITLAAMARCKHFIISNTSFGWWAQYLSVYSDKIVLVPSRWYNMRGSWQYDIYMDNWIRINPDGEDEENGE